MKLMSTAKDALGVDPRTKASPKPASDGSSNDNGSQPFDGVLSDVGSDAKGAAPADAGTKKTDGVAVPAGTATLAADAASAGTAFIDALQGLLGKGSATATGADTTSDGKDAKSEAPTDGENGVDVLLKRIASKDSAETEAETPASVGAGVPPAPSADVMSILLLGASVPSAPQAVAAAVAASTKAAPSPVGAGAALSAVGTEAATSVVETAVATAAEGTAAFKTLDPHPKTPSADVTASSDDTEMIVTDVAVSTHLPPAQPAQNKALLFGDIKGSTAVAGLGAAAMASPTASGGHTHGNDGNAAGQEAAPSLVEATALTPAAMAESLTPVRSIAAAITELAAPAAPAAATPDAPKAALGIARTMTLQMNPAELGTVDIRLHMTGQTLDLQLTISDTQTLGIVNRDRDTLTSALHDQNYTLNSLVIQDGGAAASSGGQNGTQGDSSGSNARADRQSAGTGADAQGGHRQGRDDRPTRDDRQPRGNAPSRPVPAADGRGGSLYV